MRHRSNLSIAVLGTKAVALGLVERLFEAGLGPSQLVTWDDSADARSLRSELETTCARFDVPVSVVSRSADAYAALRAGAPTLVLVAGWYQIIPSSLLDEIPRGFIGTHYSPLPRYRGSAPVVWQLINGERDIGYSLFRLSAAMDEGELAGRGFVPAGSGYIGEVLDRLNEVALDELVRIAPQLADGTHPMTSQPAERPSYTSMRFPADGRIDWTRPAGEIVRAIRAQSHPYPGAWSMCRGLKVTIWTASVEDTADYLSVPGHVVRIVDGLPVVGCGDGQGVLLQKSEGQTLSLSSRLT